MPGWTGRLCVLWCLLGAQFVSAQGGPPPPPTPLGPPPVPVENPLTEAKVQLGKVLFWEEQLSVTGTVACGTCHRPSAGGSDPRSAFVAAGSTHPGPDSVFGNADDIQGSAGVPVHNDDGQYSGHPQFGLNPQVGSRKSPPMLNAAYAPTLFWDGRAGGAFSDPLTGQLLIAQGGALENQAVAPLLNSVEMAPQGALATDVAARIATARPLALATAIPQALLDWIAGRDYAALFAEAFGDPAISPARMALAMASYQRTLVTTQAPIDQFFAGQPGALTTLEQQGLQTFNALNCRGCHAGNRFTDDNFRYLGVRPVGEDLGRFEQTGNNPDRGAFRVPSLRNVAERAPYMHNGRFQTLAEVVDFYDRGGDFNAPNKDPRIVPLGLTAQQKNALVAFLGRPLSDPRVAPELPPFDRPTLYAESERVPQVSGTAVNGSGGQPPRLLALEPPLLGNANFTLGIDQGLGGAALTVVVHSSDPGLGSSIPAGDFANLSGALSGTGSGNGQLSLQLPLSGSDALLGQTLFARAYVQDPAAPNGLAISRLVSFTVFGQGNALFADDFE